MCGLYGWIGTEGEHPDARASLAASLATFTSERGSQSHGFAILNATRQRWIRERYMHAPALDGPRLGEHDALMGHGRLMSSGRLCLEHCHPLKSRHLYLAHNGFATGTRIGRDDLDSQVLADQLSKHGTADGAYGAISYVHIGDPHGIFLCKLTPAADLAVAQLKTGGCVWASERRHLERALDWSDIAVECFYRVSPHTVYQAKRTGLYLTNKTLGETYTPARAPLYASPYSPPLGIVTGDGPKNDHAEEDAILDAYAPGWRERVYGGQR